MGSDLVVFSGGLDSTVCLALSLAAAAERGEEPPLALSFDYGQRHRTELDHAAAISRRLQVEHLVLPLDATRWGGSALTDPAIAVPAPVSEGTEPGEGEIPVTYVPARNLVFLAIATAVAEARQCQAVVIGVNALDYSGYPDCRPEFLAAFAEASRLGTRCGVEGLPIEVKAPLALLSKAEIVSLGVEVGAPLELTWSCYRGAERPCGDCDSCLLRGRGFAAAGVEDPALAALEPPP